MYVHKSKLTNNEVSLTCFANSPSSSQIYSQFTSSSINANTGEAAATEKYVYCPQG